MDFNTALESFFHWLDFPQISFFVATSIFGTIQIFMFMFVIAIWRNQQEVRVVKVNESLPEKEELLQYLIKKSNEVGDEQLSNYLRVYSLAGKMDSVDELQKNGIRFIGDVVTRELPVFRGDVEEIVRAFT